jgi:PknH-like extracellular domain
MRQLTISLAIAASGLLVTACGGANESGSTSTSTTPTSTRPPVAPAALVNLLLTPAEIDGLLGLTGTTSKEKIETLPDDSNKQWPQGWKWPAECLYAFAPVEAPVYAGSGSTAVRGDDDTTPLPPSVYEMDPEVTQAVVLFPSATQAAAFFTSSAQRWPACANHQFTTPGDADTPETMWRVGSVSNANSMLSTAMTMTMSKGTTNVNVTCQRALTVRNNVAIDVSGCRSTDPADLAVKVANQIAGKVDKQ